MLDILKIHRNRVGYFALAVMMGLYWDDEGTFIPPWIKWPLFPVFYGIMFWAFAPVGSQILATVQGKPSPLTMEDGKPLPRSSKRWSIFYVFLALLVTGLPIALPAFNLGRSWAPLPIENNSERINFLRDDRDQAVTERETWKGKYNTASAQWADEKRKLEADIKELTERISALQGQLASLEAKGMDAERRSRQRIACIEMANRVSQYRGRVEIETKQLDQKEWDEFSAEMAQFIAEELTEEQRLLMDSVAGIELPTFFPKALRQNRENRPIWYNLYRWEVRLDQIVQSLGHPQ